VLEYQFFALLITLLIGHVVPCAPQNIWAKPAAPLLDLHDQGLKLAKVKGREETEKIEVKNS